MDLIQGLPYDLARSCLLRLSYDQFATVSSVCKDWKAEIELPEFRSLRKLTGNSQKFVVVAQAAPRVNLDDDDQKISVVKYSSPVYRLALYELDLGRWSEFPPIPGYSGGLPVFCQLIGTGSDLVVIGGWDPETWKVSRSVFVYSFVSATWRRGADMPSGTRSLFGCASDSDRMVFVAGGHDNNKNGLRSAMAYDVSEDRWLILPEMARERDECKAVYQRGKLHVVGGYCTKEQGRFEKSAEAFDTTTWQWEPVVDDFLAAATCPRTCVSDDEAIYACSGGYVAASDRNAMWKVVAEMPDEVRNIGHVIAWEGNLMVIGSTGIGGPHVGHTWDLKNLTWKRLETSDEYSGHVQSGCYFEI